MRIEHLHDAVAAAFLEFTTPLEGRVPYMYLDVKGLVTTGVGNLIDPSSAAVVLPWTINGELASREAIRADWDAIKARSDLARLHHKYAAPATHCRLSDVAIDELVMGKLRTNVAHMVRYHFPTFAGWPADAQLGACSMAWALGPGFPATFKNFARVANAGDWEGAVAACRIKDGLDTPSKADDNPGIVPRNAHNRLCFSNAAFVVAHELRRDVLYWPGPAAVTSSPPPPISRPTMLAGGVSVADSIVKDALLELSKA